MRSDARRRQREYPRHDHARSICRGPGGPRRLRANGRHRAAAACAVPIRFGVPPQGGGPAGAADDPAALRRHDDAARAAAVPFAASAVRSPRRPVRLLCAADRSPPRSGTPRVAFATQESAEQLERLQHVCRLLRRARQPLCRDQRRAGPVADSTDSRQPARGRRAATGREGRFAHASAARWSCIAP